MIIGATKKAQPLFSALPSLEDKEQGRQFAQINPLFSWHANYTNVNQKKVIILINPLFVASVNNICYTVPTNRKVVPKWTLSKQIGIEEEIFSAIKVGFFVTVF